MDRLFLDANVLFSAAYRPNASLRRLWSLPEARLFTSSYAVGETRRNLAEDRQRQDLKELLIPVSVVDAPSAAETQPALEAVELPEKDLPIILAAFAAEATHLITGDITHFGRYYDEKIGGVLVLAPADYLRRSETSGS